MKKIGVGVLGFGTVGAGVAKGLLENADVLRERTGLDISLARVADLDTTSDRGVALPAGVLVSDAMAAIHDPEVQVVVELIGGTGVAKKFVREALLAGKPVVTANKKLLAESGAELFALAAEKGADLFFGASVGGGIPVIGSVRDGLAAARIETIYGILNGTCNYILTEMERAGRPFDEVLAAAQKLGFAEADPTLDVDGFDTLHKAAILAALAHGFQPDVHNLPVQGIRGVDASAELFCRAADLDADFIFVHHGISWGSGIRRIDGILADRVKLLAVVKNAADGLELRVAPTLVPASGMLGSVSGVFNAAMVHSDMDDWTMYYGRGAGRLPTACTVIGDIADAARNLAAGTRRPVTMPRAAAAPRVKAPGEAVSKFYVRLSLKDAPGSLAAAAGAFAACGVSIASAMQHGTSGGFATVIVLTHEARRAAVDDALAKIAAAGVSGSAPACFGIEEP